MNSRQKHQVGEASFPHFMLPRRQLTKERAHPPKSKCPPQATTNAVRLRDRQSLGGQHCLVATRRFEHNLFLSTRQVQPRSSNNRSIAGLSHSPPFLSGCPARKRKTKNMPSLHIYINIYIIYVFLHR